MDTSQQSVLKGPNTQCHLPLAEGTGNAGTGAVTRGLGEPNHRRARFHSPASRYCQGWPQLQPHSPKTVPGAEVSLRLAFHLLDHPASAGEASVALDGAQVRVHGKQVFAVEGFLADQGWKQTSQEGRNPWQGAYERNGAKLIVHASSGVGDVVTHVGHHRILAECKKGPLIHKPGSQERPVLHEAIGQLLTIESLQPNDVLAAAVPLTEPFATLVSRWRLAPLLIESGIRLVMVGRDGSIDGLTLETKA